MYEGFPTLHKDYLYRFSNDECHPDFHFWACTTMVGALLGPRVWINHGRFKAIPVLFTVLVGKAGSGKNSSTDVVKDLMREYFQEHILSDTIQSREDIVAQM